ncbi:MAG: zinc ribbon domain-containing protein [Acidobacteriota bacterium]
MNDRVRCQSCGMPLSEEFKNFGTGADGSPVGEYCMFCYKNGDFTNADQTVEEMVQSSIVFMTANLGFSEEEATQMSNDVIPKLKRWQHRI